MKIFLFSKGPTFEIEKRELLVNSISASRIGNVLSSATTTTRNTTHTDVDLVMPINRPMSLLSPRSFCLSGLPANCEHGAALNSVDGVSRGCGGC